MKVLVACEESQAVCKAFREKGHEAYSCDIQECSGGHPEWHIQGDVLELLNPIKFGSFERQYYGIHPFCTMDGKEHFIEGKWDMIIAFPPCTYLSNAGAARLYKKIDGKSYCELERLNKGFDAKDFFMSFLNADCDKIAIENPIPSGVYRLPPYTQIVQPYEHGHEYSKKTCLWLKGLRKLTPTKKVKPICSWVSGGSKDNNGNKRENCGMTFRDSKTKSKTFEGIAKAMAEQWGNAFAIECYEQQSFFD